MSYYEDLYVKNNIVVISPERAAFDFKSSIIESCIKDINEAIQTATFHYDTTKESKYFIVVAKPAPFDDKIGEAVAQEMIEAGWDAKYDSGYCAHGPYNAFYFRTDKLNPQTVEFKTKQ